MSNSKILSNDVKNTTYKSLTNVCIVIALVLFFVEMVLATKQCEDLFSSFYTYIFLVLLICAIVSFFFIDKKVVSQGAILYLLIIATIWLSLKNQLTTLSFIHTGSSWWNHRDIFDDYTALNNKITYLSNLIYLVCGVGLSTILLKNKKPLVETIFALISNVLYVKAIASAVLRGFMYGYLFMMLIIAFIDFVLFILLLYYDNNKILYIKNIFKIISLILFLVLPLAIYWSLRLDFYCYECEEIVSVSFFAIPSVEQIVFTGVALGTQLFKLILTLLVNNPIKRVEKPMSSKDAFACVKQLFLLRQSGLISQEEFDAKKQKYIRFV